MTALSFVVPERFLRLRHSSALGLVCSRVIVKELVN
jgi:hypothetical protein